MTEILLAGSHRSALQTARQTLESLGARTHFADTAASARDLVAERPLDLVVLDETVGEMTGLDLLKAILPIRPMINSAVVSPLSPAEFHDAGEGLGILMQLPVDPDREAAERLFEQLMHVLNLTRSTAARER